MSITNPNELDAREVKRIKLLEKRIAKSDKPNDIKLFKTEIFNIKTFFTKDSAETQTVISSIDGESWQHPVQKKDMLRNPRKLEDVVSERKKFVGDD